MPFLKATFGIKSCKISLVLSDRKILTDKMTKKYFDSNFVKATILVEFTKIVASNDSYDKNDIL